ncbi:signal peptidase II [Sinosporangium album]|uniref:Lipoprotein signal peptidase n=1 Tax=Sinosporangium album TaxID=504805 RepID=A0A1G7XB62_9ACTN|nr:signal peptidase II [Sinosporangium album]SDG81384.1 signal peptidase II [Sinosporangium album]
MRGLQAAGGAPLNGGSGEGAGSGEAGGADSAPRGGSHAPGDSRGTSPFPKRVGLLAVIAVAIYLSDLASKIVVVETVEGRAPVELISGLLQFRVIRNSGAAFSIGAGLTLLLTAVATIVVIAILRTAKNLRSLPWAVTLGLLLGGALGNLTDRVFRSPGVFEGHVVDFVEVFPGHFPIFNVADSSIVCGGTLAVFLAWRGYQIDGTRDTGDVAPAKAAEAGEAGEADADGPGSAPGSGPVPGAGPASGSGGDAGDAGKDGAHG